MEELLCDAAVRGDLESLEEIIVEDNYILDKVLVGCFKGKNPLHVAISTGQAEFVLKLLDIKPKLAEVIDAELGAALHVASANGNLQIVEALVKLSPEMCMARDRDGYNPLHIAAMKGKVDVLKKLVQTCPRAAQVISDRGNNILHLCVNYNQLESLQLLLEMIRYPNFVHSKDANGNTILHLAVFGMHFEIIEYVLNSTEINVNAINADGWTARDIHYFVRPRPHWDEVNVHIKNLLLATRAKRRIEMLVLTPTNRREEKLQQTLMVVASLFATMAFQVAVNPPGGVWQDDSEEHQAGKAILAYKYGKSYSCFMFFNTVAFLLALNLILSQQFLAVPVPQNRLGWGPLVAPVVTIMITAFAYTNSVIVISPKHTMAVTNIILVSVIVWAFVMLFVAGGIVVTQEYARTKKDRERMSRLARERPRLLPNAVGENVPRV